MRFSVIRRPWQLNGPTHLVSDAVEKAAYLAGCGRCLDLQARIERGALIVIAKPGFTRAIGQERYGDSDEERKKILLE